MYPRDTRLALEPIYLAIALFGCLVILEELIQKYIRMYILAIKALTIYPS